MKKILQVAFLFLSISSLAQFTLEHTYQNLLAVRIKLGINGEKYYQFNKPNGILLLYNSDYSLWKEIHLPVPQTTTDVSFWFVTDDLFNTDDKIEIAYTYFFSNDSGNAKEGKIINEDGQVLLTVPDAMVFQNLQVDGLESKILASLPNNAALIYSRALILEHTYPTTTRRVKLENSGEKYYYFSNGNQLRIYNADHTLWKTIALPVPSGSNNVTGLSLLSEMINSDGLVKVGYNYQTPGANFSQTYEGRLIDETGQILLMVPDATFFKINTVFGLAPKLLVSTQFYQSIPTFYDFTSMKVYSVPGLQLEHDYYPDRMDRANFGISGEKYYSTTIRANHIDLYNADHSFWKTINFMNNGLPAMGTLSEVSQTTFNNDALIEVAYNYYNGDNVNCKVVNELGTEMLNVPLCNSLRTSKIDGLEDKLIGQLYNNAYNGTVIYDIDSDLHAENFNGAKLAIYPNPVSSEVFIDAKISVDQISIYNANGRQVAHYNGPEITRFSVSDLPNGLYLLRLSDILGKVTNHKLFISR